MIYRKICIVALSIIGLFIIFQGFTLHKEMKEFSNEEKEVRQEWKETSARLCPGAVYPCNLKGDLRYLQDKKDEMKRTYIYKFILLGALSVPCFILLYKKKQ